MSLNVQTKYNKDGTIKSRGIEWCTHTWNVIQGCMHDCRWTMPDGQVAECYAKTIADKFRSPSFMPDGFEHHYFNPERLDEPLKLKVPGKLFLDSASDIMGHWTPVDQIQQVLDVCAKADWHTFQLLTKNAPRLLKFQFPDNVWVGVSSPPDFMFGKPVDTDRQHRMLSKSLDVLATLRKEGRANVTFMSFEPLSWDVSGIVRDHPDALRWAIIGAASRGNQYYPPRESDTQALVDVLDSQGVRVFYKGNLKSLPYAAANWREEFPTIQATKVDPVPVQHTDKEQLAMFDVNTGVIEHTPPDVHEASRQYMLYLKGLPSTYKPPKRKV